MTTGDKTQRPGWRWAIVGSLAATAITASVLIYFPKLWRPRMKRTKSFRLARRPSHFEKLKDIAALSSLTEDQLVSVYELISSKIGAGLTREDFGHAMAECKVTDTHLVESLFRLWDTKRDGIIDASELIFAIFMMSDDCPKETKLRYIFKAYDLDRDGFLNSDELMTVFSAVFRTEGLQTDEAELKDRLNTLVKEVLFLNDKDHGYHLTEDQFVHLSGIPNLEISGKGLAIELLS